MWEFLYCNYVVTNGGWNRLGQQKKSGSSTLAVLICARMGLVNKILFESCDCVLGTEWWSNVTLVRKPIVAAVNGYALGKPTYLPFSI